MSEADGGQMLDLDMVVLDSYERAAAERAHQCGAEKNCPDAILTISYKVQVWSVLFLCKTKWKPEATGESTNVAHSGISKWVNWVCLIFVKARQIRVCLLGHVHKTGNPESGGGKSNPPQSQGWGMLLPYFWVKKREVGEPIVYHTEDIVSLGLTVWIHSAPLAR